MTCFVYYYLVYIHIFKGREYHKHVEVFDYRLQHHKAAISRTAETYQICAYVCLEFIGTSTQEGQFVPTAEG